jgi:hypothetical protein
VFHCVLGSVKLFVGSSTGFSPFFLVYDSDVILPTDVAFGSPHVQFYEEGVAE